MKLKLICYWVLTVTAAVELLVGAEWDLAHRPDVVQLVTLSFAITPSARNKLTSKRMKANNRDTCQPFFCL
jgi:hypothetical protein